MRSITQIKSLADAKTGISTHARSAPRREGATYLDVFLLDKERQRLETELAMLAKRQHRIEVRLGELQDAMSRQVGKAQASALATPRPTSAGAESRRPEAGIVDSEKWRRLTVDY